MKRETLVWMALGGALLVAFFWYRKRKGVTVQSGMGSTVGTTIAGSALAPPASTLPLTLNTGIIGPGASTLGSSAAGPIDVTPGLGGAPVNAPVPLKGKWGGTPIIYRPTPVLA